MTTSAGTAHAIRSYLPLTLLVGGVQMIATMDLVTMGVLLTSIGKDFAVGPVRLSGLVSFSSLVFASMMLIGGRLSDMFGQRVCIALGLIVAMGGAVLAGLAPYFSVLVAGRLLFGLGSAIMIPANFSVINTVIPAGPPRHRAYGIYGMVQGIALIVGPSLGGFLATQVGWRWMFFVVAVLMLGLLAASRLLVPAGVPAQRQRFDYAGSLLFVPAILALVLAISGGSGLIVDLSARLGLGFAGAVLMGLFVRNQARGASPLLPLSVFRHHGVPSAIVGLTALMAASAGLFMLPPLVMQQAMHWSPAESGLGMLPHALSVIVTGHFASWFMGRFPPYRNVVIGFSTIIAGLFLNGFMGPGHGYLLNVMIPMLLGAAGSIFLVITLTAIVTAPQPHEQQGVIAAVAFTSQQLGISLGAVALLSVAAESDAPFTVLNHAFFVAAAIALGGLLIVLWGAPRGARAASE